MEEDLELRIMLKETDKSQQDILGREGGGGVRRASLQGLPKLARSESVRTGST